MALKLMVVADNGHIFADQFLVIKPSRGTVLPGLEAEIYERCGTLLGKATLMSKTQIRPKYLNDNVCYIATGQNSDVIKADMQKHYPTEPYFDIICLQWTERDPFAWNILMQMRMDSIHKYANVTTEKPQHQFTLQT
jgi:hypothetical protein